MPLRPLSREQTWLLPPTLDELIPEDHSARYIAAFVDALERTEWAQMGIDLEGEVLGAPAYHPRALLSVWLYGFMTGVRSSRKLEAACRDQVPYLWLTGWQHPDHNTLWRFYQAHREGLRSLFKRTVRTAVEVGLVDLAVQAVDGTKVGGNAAKDRTYNAAGLQRLLERTEAAIQDLEAQNAAGEDPSPPRLPEALRKAQALREQVQAALERIKHQEGVRYLNLTDEDAGLLKSRQGFVAGYNAQAMVSPLDSATAGRTGLLITAAGITNSPRDDPQLVPLLEQAEELTGQAATMTLADGGYHSGPNLVACAVRAQVVVMPESHTAATLQDPYHKDAFLYDATRDTYTCPQGQTLHFWRVTKRPKQPEVREYKAGAAVCLACPAFGGCTKNRWQGRTIKIGPEDAALRQHRVWMATAAAQAAYARRKALPEPAFGILKELQGARRFLLRGLAQVAAEWTLLATSFNLRTLYRVWCTWGGASKERWALTGAQGA